MNLEEQIIDVIVQCISSIRFGKLDKAAAFDQFYTKTQALYDCNSEQFDACSFSLLKPDDFSLFVEPTIIKLECAGVYHKNGLDVFLFRMRYFLNIASDQDDILLEKKAASAFIFRGENPFATFDAQSPYEKLFFDVLKNANEPNDRLRNVLRNFVEEKWAVSFENLVPFVQVSKIIGKKISGSQETLFLVLTEIPMIVSDGLHLWITNNPDYEKMFTRLATAFKKMGMVEVQKLFELLKEKFSGRAPIEWTADCIAAENDVEEHIHEREILNAARLYFEKQNVAR